MCQTENGKDKKKILVVLTGGTIGSRIDGTTIDVTEASSYQLINLYEQQYGETDEFEVLRPFSILSENMRPEIWTKLVRTLWDIPWERYQGVIVTHGSDTLSYTSALLGMLFSHVPVPLVLTASNYPLGEKGSNGLNNFRSSVCLLKTQGLKGVFTVYQNNKGENNVYLATRITEADCYLDQFGAFGGVPFGKVEKDRLKVIESPVNPTLSQLGVQRQALTEKCPTFRKQVLFIRPYPGMDYGAVDLSNKPAAVLHYLYHSATACTEAEQYSLPCFLKRCAKENIPVYTASYKSLQKEAYITAKEVLGAGAIPVLNISPEAAYMKLMLFCNMDEAGNFEKVIYYENLPAAKSENC